MSEETIAMARVIHKDVTRLLRMTYDPILQLSEGPLVVEKMMYSFGELHERAMSLEDRVVDLINELERSGRPGGDDDR